MKEKIEQDVVSPVIDYRDTDGFFCDADMMVWHKGKCFGHVFKRELWDKEDLRIFIENCAGT